MYIMETYYYCNNKLPVLVSNKVRKLTPHTFYANLTLHEPESIDYFYSNVPKDKKVNILDIGAQSGLYSLYAKYLPMSSFYSFEPFKPTFELLNENISLNNITNIKTFNIGLSNKKEQTTLNTCLSHNGLHTIGETPKRFNDICKIEIEVDTIDNLFYEKDICVDFIKIDTEGYEFFILKGGEKTVKRYKPFIQLEWNETNMLQCNVKLQEFSNYLNELGYIKINHIEENAYFVHKNSLISSYLKKHFELLNNTPNVSNIKIDIGLSYSAPQSNDWLKKEPNLFVFGFEPNQESVINILQKNIEKKCHFHGDPLRNEFIHTRFELIPVALSNVPEPTTMEFYSMLKDTGTSSLYKPIDCNLGPIKNKTMVDVYSLKHFFDAFPWDRFEYIDYIKIDAQGSDFDIIKSAGKYLEDRVVFITAEPEHAQYEKCEHNTTENMVEYLKTHNFERIFHSNTRDPTFINKKFYHLKDSIYIRQLS